MESYEVRLMLNLMEYNLNATNSEVMRDLVKNRGWDFLCVRDWEGEKTDGLWWNYYKGGWHDIWNQYLISLGELYDKIPDKDKFYIFDTKSKYGTLRVSTSFITDETLRLENTVNYISRFTCEKCGKQPKDSKGKHIIWSSKGYWVEQLCKKCARLSCYETRNLNYKDSLLIGKTFNSKETISEMMENFFHKENCDSSCEYLFKAH